MDERMHSFAEYSTQIDNLIRAARTNPRVESLLHYGTPDQKLEVLQEFGLTFEDLLILHRQLEAIIYQGSLRWWWW